MTLDATVFIPTYNGAMHLDSVMTAIRGQRIDAQFEILVIDSGSSDETVEIIQRHAESDARVHLIEIPNSEFQHGRTRNLAAELARGDYVAYLTQDACPSSNRWLEFLLEPFTISSEIKGVFGKQIPQKDCDTTTRREITSVFDSLGPDHSIMIHRHESRLGGGPFSDPFSFYSDVNSAAPREFLLCEQPYEEVNYAEDQIYGLNLLLRGYMKAYSPLASVYHSNQYNLGEFFARKVDEFTGVEEALGVKQDRSIPAALGATAKGTLQDLRYALSDREQDRTLRIKGSLQSPVRHALWNSARLAAARSGKRRLERLSLENRRRSGA